VLALLGALRGVQSKGTCAVGAGRFQVSGARERLLQRTLRWRSHWFYGFIESQGFEEPKGESLKILAVGVSVNSVTPGKLWSVGFAINVSVRFLGRGKSSWELQSQPLELITCFAGFRVCCSVCVCQGSVRLWEWHVGMACASRSVL